MGVEVGAEVGEASASGVFEDRESPGAQVAVLREKGYRAD